jgi:hypothetical protein
MGEDKMSTEVKVKYQLTEVELKDMGDFITTCFDLNDAIQNYQSEWAKFGFLGALDYVHNVALMQPLSTKHELSQSQAQIAELKAEIKRLNDKYDFQWIVKQNKDLENHIRDLEVNTIMNLELQLKEARGVVEFYGDKQNWSDSLNPYRDDKIDSSDLELSEDGLEDGGKLARAYLLKYPSEG